MRHVTFADLIARRVPLVPSEAVALALAVSRLLDARRESGQCVRLPDDEWILLSSSGEVSIVEVHASSDADETARLSALLRRLLRLDERLPSTGQAAIPGGLLIVLARNLGYIHLPATGPDAFRVALERFATANPAVLAAVFWRAAGAHPARSRSANGIPAMAATSRVERRREGASRTELRRALRELERELFELRGRFHASAVSVHRRVRTTRQRVVAATLAACLTAAVAAAAFAVTRETPTRAAARADIALSPRVPNVPSASPVPSTPRASVVAADGAAPRAVPPPQPRGTATRAAQVHTDRERGRVPGMQRVSVTSDRDDAPVRQPEATVKPARRADPLAALRGGTRGIPFALPPG